MQVDAICKIDDVVVALVVVVSVQALKTFYVLSKQFYLPIYVTEYTLYLFLIERYP